MKSTKIITLIVTIVLLMQVLAACGGNGSESLSGGSEQTEETNTTVAEDGDPVKLGISGVKISDTSSIGDKYSVFSDSEAVWTGLENNQTLHYMAVALESPSVITTVVIKTPVTQADTDTLKAAVLEASADGKEWVELRVMGTMLSPDKIYNTGVQSTETFGYFRIRQSDNNLSNAFTLRYFEIWGVPKSGAAPDINNVSGGLGNESRLITMKAVSVYQTNAGNPADIFVNGNTLWSGSQYLPIRHSIVATMEKKTVITQIKMIVPNPIAGTNKMKGSDIEASADGENWVKLATVDSIIKAGATYIYFVEDKTAFGYIRITQSEELIGSGYDVPNFMVLGTPTGEDTVPFPENHIDGEYMTVTTLETSLQAGGDSALVFAENSDSLWLGADKQDSQHFIIGELPEDTIITRIIYRNTNQFLVRSRGTQIQVSDDKETWTTIVTLPTAPDDPLFPNNAEGYSAEGEYREYFVDLDKPYRYFRVIQANSLISYYWTLGNLNFYGIEV